MGLSPCGAEILRGYLDAGLSLERIASWSACPSTVEYWVKKHGLRIRTAQSIPARAASSGRARADGRRGVDAMRRWSRPSSLATVDTGSAFDPGRDTVSSSRADLVPRRHRTYLHPSRRRGVHEGRTRSLPVSGVPSRARCGTAASEGGPGRSRPVPSAAMTAAARAGVSPPRSGDETPTIGGGNSWSLSGARKRRSVLLCGNCHAEVERAC